VNPSAETAVPPSEDPFDDLLARVEALHSATSARISRLDVSLGTDAPTRSRAITPAPAAAPTSTPKTTPPTTPDPGRRMPSVRLPRPARAGLVAGAGVALLLAIAGLARSPEAASEPVRPAPPSIVEFLPDLTTPVAPVIPPPTPEVEPEAEVRSVPVTVRIPSITVDAATLPVGLEVDGSMEIPRDVSTIGWYEPTEGFGVTPGQTGTAVLAGHVDSRTQGPGAFYSLRDLTVGDRIEIVHEDGSTSLWRVTAVTQYPKDELPIAEVFIWTGPPRLALITCGGPFDWTARSYTDNLVVYAEPDTTERTDA
jgi:sortase (surface protein transpeptidase)